LVNFLEICVRLDLRAQAWYGGVPSSMEVVGEDAEPVDLSLEAIEIDVPQVLVLRWDSDTKTEIATQSLEHVLQKMHLVSLVAGIAAPVGVTGPLPIDIHAAELVDSQELL
jgi:hypothetical protein